MSPVNKTPRQRTEAEKRKQEEFFELAHRLRNTTDPEEAKGLGDEHGRMVFGGQTIVGD
ncbi:MAG: hypothetical protein PVS2B2_15700 [Candidatus Acidiferrum sp.]